MTRRAILNESNIKSIGTTMLAGILASSILFLPAVVQTAALAQSAPTVKPAAVSTPYRNQPPRIANKAAAIYESVWGVGDLSVKSAESGLILRFSYRVFDPVKAKPLNDKKLSPVLESPEKGVQLVVPTMEKVGQLRQAPQNIEAGKSYWMAFSNSGRTIKPGDHVDVVIGNFRARGLVVE